MGVGGVLTFIELATYVMLGPVDVPSCMGWVGDGLTFIEVATCVMLDPVS